MGWDKSQFPKTLNLIGDYFEAPTKPEKTELPPAEAGGLKENVRFGLEVLNSLFSYLKTVTAITWLAIFLISDVFHNHLVGHISA